MWPVTAPQVTFLGGVLSWVGALLIKTRRAG